MAISGGADDRAQRWEPMHGDLPLWCLGTICSEPGEDPLAASARELFEETGITGVPVSTSPALVDAIVRR